LRREILHKLRDEERKKTREGFPASVTALKGLFDFLDAQLSEHECDDTLRFVREHLRSNAMDEAGVILWLEANSGNCDCEVLNNAEQIVSEAVPAYDDLASGRGQVN
jgi:Protein of unknown function (DUF2695)